MKKQGLTPKNELLLRSYVIFGGFVVAFILIFGQACKIVFVEGDYWRNKFNNRKVIAVEGDRGDIFSADGQLLASSIQFFEIRFDPAASSDKLFAESIDALCLELEKYADSERSARQWKSYLSSKREGWQKRKEKGSRDIPFVSKADYDLYTKFKSFPLLKHGSNKGGLIVRRFTSRVKPYRNLASRTIGEDRANHENMQQVGLEEYYNDILKGQTKSVLMRKLPGNNWIPLVDTDEIKMRKGADVHSTIHMEMQDIVSYELEKSIRKHEAKGGVAILMEVATGKIRAISNLSRDGGKVWEEWNNAIGLKSEPGSTFKLATSLALLEQGKVDLTTQVNLEGGVKEYYGHKMKDSDQHGKSYVSFEDVFAMSSNIGMAKLAQGNFGKNKSEFYGYLREFGLTEKTGIDISGEDQPLVRDPRKEKWSGLTLPWMAHGYGLELTPLQILNFYNAVANEGALMKPLLVEKIVEESGNITDIHPFVINESIASDKSLHQVQYLLRKTVETGTAKNIDSKKIKLAGKTGTTTTDYNKKDKEKGYISSFAGYFPADNPKYSAIVVVYDPKTKYYGSQVAAPVFKNIAERCFILNPLIDDLDEVKQSDHRTKGLHASGYAKDYKVILDSLDYNNVDIKGSWVRIEGEADRIYVKEDKIAFDVVPDVRGMGISDAMYVLENLGLDVDFTGVGHVDEQSLKPGSKIEDSNIQLRLN